MMQLQAHEGTEWNPQHLLTVARDYTEKNFNGI